MSKPKKAKKQNPRDIPATAADVEKARTQGAEYGIAIAIYAMVKDRDEATDDEIQRLSRNVKKVCENIQSGHLKIKDILKTLDEEYEIEIRLK